ncbi:MAG: hypothetical protein Kow0062_10500 [Acidobacteriota bacterium]
MSRRRVHAGAGLLVLLALAARPVPAPDADGAPRQPQPARRALLERIVAEEGIETAVPAPVSAWAGDVMRRVLHRMFAPATRALGLLGPAAKVILWGLVIVGIAAVLALIGYAVERRLARPRAPAPEVELVDEPEPEDPRAEIERALADGRATDALRWLWRLVARRLAERGLPGSDTSRTNRELVRLARARWPDWSAVEALDELARRSDRLLYAGEGADPAEVRRLVARAEALAG